MAYGFPGLIVDGNDVLAVYTAVSAAVVRARSGGGPSFIEAQTYRLGPHTTVDDPTRYRSEEEVRSQEALDPVIRLRAYLQRLGRLSPEQEQLRLQEYEQWAREEAKAAEELVRTEIEDIFAYHYAVMPPYLQEQMAYLRRVVAAKGGVSHG